MRFIAPLCLALLCPATAQPTAGQTQTEEEEIVAVVQALFDAMAEADSARVRSLTQPGGQLIATGAGDDGLGVRIIPMERFIAAIGDADGWHERIWDWEVRIDGNLATVWTRYDFHLKGEFSHCGVDSFQLARTAQGWKIVSIADTRRTEGCREPPGG